MVVIFGDIEHILRLEMFIDISKLPLSVILPKGDEVSNRSSYYNPFFKFELFGIFGKDIQLNLSQNYNLF